jgi:16S rRNA (cytidine1402-2'-O)-methyltransferase
VTEGAGGTGGTLYVVATPIGNLSDITLRALDVLAAVPLIAAEDTRLTRRLLNRHAIATRLTSYHAKSGAGRLRELIEHLRAGSDLALVTDAGTPAVSDPGADVVSAWAGLGGRVVPVPGASAVLAAIAASGVAGPRWVFEGFLPRSGRERRDRLAGIAADPRGTVVFEAPGRVEKTLRDLVTACGEERAGAIARELTKLHEQIVRGSLGSLADAVGDGTIPGRGEFVLVIGMGEAAARDGSVADVEAARLAVERLVGEGVARGEAARRIAAETGLPRRRLYGGSDVVGS